MLLLGLHVCSVEVCAKEVLGSLTAAGGEVQVNKVVGLPGTTLREGDVIATGAKSLAIISLQSGAKVRVGERSEVALPYDTVNPRLELREGALAIQTGSGQVSQVNTKFETSVILQGVDGFPALCRVAAIGPEVEVLNDKGRVEIHGAGPPILVPPGKYVVLQAGKPQGGLETAGKVIAAIPSEVVERQGAAAVPLKLNDPVYWQDSVKTEMNGRVRIGLTGGSVLSIGARSQMRIVKHDAATEQTILELGVGKFRGQVVKLTKPGASFKITTQTAVVGVVGTDIVVVSNPDSTTVYDVDGKVKVCADHPPRSNCADSQSGQSTTPCPGCANSQSDQSTTPCAGCANSQQSDQSKSQCPCCKPSQNGQPPKRCCPTSQSGQPSQSDQSTTSCPCCVALLPGQFTTVPANGAPSPPADFSPQALANELSQTSVQAIQSGAGWGGAWTIGSIVVAGTAAGVSAVAISGLGNASDLFNQVGCSVHQYLSTYIPISGTCP
jgi:hypothetical protein